MLRPPLPRPPARPGRASAARPALAGAACLAALLVSACGSSHSSSGTEADPAGVVPAGARAYLGATVRPSGAQRQAALQAGFRLTRRTDPYQRLAAVLQTPGSPALDYTRDLSPWLGPHAGLFESSPPSAAALLPVAESLVSGGAATAAFPFGSRAAEGAVVLDTRDLGRARSFVARQAQRAGAHAASFGGVGYQVTASGIAFALVDRFVVVGTESAVHRVIETAHGAAPLSRAAAYAQLQAAAPHEAIAHLFAPAAGAAAGARGATGAGGLLAALGGGRALNASLLPSASALTLVVDMLGPGAAGGSPGALGSAAEGAGALAELPGESWLALGLGHAGASIAADVAVLKGVVALGAGASTGGSALNLGSLLNGLLTPLSVLAAETPQARRDFASWMGSAGVFAAGAGLLELKAAVVIESTDAALSRAAVAKLGAQLSRSGGSVSPASIPGTEAAESVRTPGLPVALELAAGRDGAGRAKFVLGLGEASVAAALNPPNRLAGSAAAGAAASALGEGIQPNLIFQTPTLLALLESLGLTEDPTLARVLPYLRNTTGVVAGGRQLGNGVQRVRLALQLRPG